MKKIVNKLMAFMLSLIVIAQIPINAFAVELSDENNSSEDIKVQRVTDNSLSVTENNDVDLIKINENINIKQVTILNKKTGKIDYIKYNKKLNTLYSSFTNKTINLNLNSELKPDLSSLYERSSVSYKTIRISYAQIKSIVGKSASAGEVIGAILTLIPQINGIGGAISSVSIIVGRLNNYTPSSSKHGIKLRVKVTKYYRSRVFGRRHLYNVSHDIVGCEFY